MKNKYKTEEKKNPKLVNMILAVHLKEHVRVPEVERQTVQSPPSLVETQVPQKVARTEEKEDSREEEKEDEDGEIEGALSESSDEDDSDDDLRIRDIL